MTRFFNKLKSLLPGGLSRDAAKRIARDACAPSLDSIQVYDAPQPGWCLYFAGMDGPCWFVTVPSGGPFWVQRTTLVVLSKSTGKVIYCGSAMVRIAVKTDAMALMKSDSGGLWL
jgi:hypothetical protein